MLRAHGKKINAAFRRLRDRRAAVNKSEGTPLTPEQEAKQLADQVRAAAAANNIAQVLHLITQASSMQPADYIKNTVGNLRFLYYTYLHELHVKPIDLIDMIDGLLYLDAHRYIQQRAMDEAKAKVRSENGGQV